LPEKNYYFVKEEKYEFQWNLFLENMFIEIKEFQGIE
jgi:hypothetical protein